MTITLDDIRARDKEIGAFVYIDEDSEIDGKDDLPLSGLPFAVKDFIDVKGWTITRGSRHFHDPAKADAEIVRQLREAGAKPIGFVKTYELATVGPDTTSLYAQPRNPWNLDHITGGSSSGSAAAVAAGMVPFALGTDTGGSVRSPAAYCGVVGFKPSKGLLPMQGVAPLAQSLDHLGILAKSVADIEAVMRAIRPEFGSFAPARKIAYARNWSIDAEAHKSLLGMMDRAASTLSLLGLEIVVTEFPEYQPIEDAAATLLFKESFANYGALVLERPRDFGDMARASILLGQNVSSDNVKSAKAVLRKFEQFTSGVFEAHDLIITPTVLAPAPSFADYEGKVAPWTAMRTMPFNATGQPAISVPMGFAEGLPLGLQIIGAMGTDAMVLKAAAAFEAATDYSVASPYFA